MASKRGPVARGFSRAAIDNQIFGPLGDVWVEVVHQAAKRCLLMPALAIQFCAEWRAYSSCGSIFQIADVAAYSGLLLCSNRPEPTAVLALCQLLQFAGIQPDTATLFAGVDLYFLKFILFQVAITSRAAH